MAQLSISLDDWLYEEIIHSKPKDVSKSAWLRELVVRGLRRKNEPAVFGIHGLPTFCKEVSV